MENSYLLFLQMLNVLNNIKGSKFICLNLYWTVQNLGHISLPFPSLATINFPL